MPTEEYPVVQEISDDAKMTIANEAAKQRKNFRNLAKLRLDTLPNTNIEEEIFDSEKQVVVKKKRRMTKAEWATSWHAPMLAQASRFKRIEDEMRKPDQEGEDGIEEATADQVGETGVPKASGERRIHARPTEIRSRITEDTRRALRSKTH